MIPSAGDRRKQQLLFGVVCPIVTYAAIARAWMASPMWGMGLVGAVLLGFVVLVGLADSSRDGEIPGNSPPTPVNPISNVGSTTIEVDEHRDTSWGPVTYYGIGMVATPVLAIAILWLVQ